MSSSNFLKITKKARLRLTSVDSVERDDSEERSSSNVSTRSIDPKFFKIKLTKPVGESTYIGSTKLSFPGQFQRKSVDHMLSYSILPKPGIVEPVKYSSFKFIQNLRDPMKKPSHPIYSGFNRPSCRAKIAQALKPKLVDPEPETPKPIGEKPETEQELLMALGASPHVRIEPILSMADSYGDSSNNNRKLSEFALQGAPNSPAKPPIESPIPNQGSHLWDSRSDHEKDFSAFLKNNVPGSTFALKHKRNGRQLSIFNPELSMTPSSSMRSSMKRKDSNREKRSIDPRRRVNFDEKVLIYKYNTDHFA